MGRNGLVGGRMTIQELVGKAQKAIRDAEEAIQALNEIVDSLSENVAYHYKQGDAQCITIVAPK